MLRHSQTTKPIKGSHCFLEQETLPSLLMVLVGSRNGFELENQNNTLQEDHVIYLLGEEGSNHDFL